jgi:serine/threonine protein kinase
MSSSASFEPAKEPEANQSGAQTDCLSGSLLDGRYELISLLGSGASGSVYKARDILMDRVLVAKILHKHLLASPVALERFRKEAVTSTGLNHHGIIHVYCHGVADDGRPYMVMEFLEGKSLAQILRAEGRFSIQCFLSLFLQVCEALSYAHEKGIVHRDIKPSNIIVVREEGGLKPVIVDFGIARAVDEAGDQGSTRTGVLLGSSAYMSPEQCRAADVDARSDIYSLGCVMFEALVGAAPFAGGSELDVMYKHLNESAGRLGKLHELPEAVARILRRCLEKQPQARYQSLAELQSDLEKCVEIQDRLTRSYRHDWRRLKSGPLIAAGAAAVLLAAVASSYFYFCRSRSSTLETKPPAPASPIEKRPLPQSGDAISEMLISAAVNGRRAESMAIARRWEQSYLNSQAVSLTAKVAVLKHMIEMSVQDKQYTEASECLKRLEGLRDCSDATRLFVAEKKAAIYRAGFQPEKGIKELESVLHSITGKYKETVFCLITEADCYFDCGNAGKAASLYLQGVKLSQDLTGRLGWQTNAFRAKAIVALSKLGKTAEADGLLADSLNNVELRRGEKLDRIKLDDGRTRSLVLKDLKPSSLPPAGSPPATVMDGPDAGMTLGTLADEFLRRHDLENYKKYAKLSVRGYEKDGKVAQASKVQWEMIAELELRADYAAAAEEAKLFLQDPINSDFSAKLQWLVCIASACAQIDRRSCEREFEDQAYRLVNQQLEKDPDLLIKQPMGDCVTLLSLGEADGQAKPEDLQRKIDSYIDKCRGRDCLTLRQLNCFNSDYLVRTGRLDQALALCQANQDYFAARQPAEAEFLFEWLSRKGDILARKLKLSEALQTHLVSLDVLSRLQPEKIGDRKIAALFKTAGVCQSLGKNDEALKYYLLMDKEIGSDFCGYCPAASNSNINQLVTFGSFCSDTGDYARADAVLNRVERAVTCRFADDCVQMIAVSYGRARLRLKQKRLPEAVKLFKKVVDLSQKYGIKNNMYRDSLAYTGQAGKN